MSLHTPKIIALLSSQVAAANGTGYLVGNSLTVADLSLLEALLAYVEYFGMDIFKDFPAMKVLYVFLNCIILYSHY